MCGQGSPPKSLPAAKCCVSAQEGAEMVLHLLLPLLLRDAHPLPRRDSGHRQAARHKGSHRPAGAGHLRLLRLRHEQDRPAAGQ